MNQKHIEALNELREQGYAVAIFSPSELEGAPADQVEDIMIGRGWGAIHDLMPKDLTLTQEEQDFFVRALLDEYEKQFGKVEK